MKNKTKDLTLITEPNLFFKDLIAGAIEKQKVDVQPETEIYLVHLLKQFMTTDNLFGRTGDGQVIDQPLTFKLKEAIEETAPHAQSLLFRHLGDFSLYVAGYFQESLTRKWVDVDYYIDMGGTAYQQVAVRVEERPLQSMYKELGTKFAHLVDVLGVVSEQTRKPSDETELLRMYESFMRTGSDRAKRLLEEAGIETKIRPGSKVKVKKGWQ